MLQANNLIRGKIVSNHQFQKNTSPVDGKETSQVSLLSRSELVGIFTHAKEVKDKKLKNNYHELAALARFLKSNHLSFVKQIIRDSGFTQKDSQDLVDCAIEFCHDYHLHLKQLPSPETTTSFSLKKRSTQNIHYTSSPFGIVAATTPRNTPLITELTVIVHALWSGNILVLRPSPAVAGTISLLIDGLTRSFQPETLERLNIVFSNAKDFIDSSLDYANLLHYIGSSKYLEGTLVAGIKRGIKVLVDGDGCSLVLIDSTANIKEAAKACYEGLIRCNGQICISVRVIIIEKTIYKQFLSYFLPQVEKTIVAPPALNKKLDMGPLFSAAQVENIKDVTKKYQILRYQQTRSPFGSNYISPVVVELNPTNRTFLRENVFGPIVGVSYFEKDNWKRWLNENPINLTDAVFSNNDEFIKEFITTSNSPRKVINNDPTIESVFEPWGAFLPSGWNDVSYWYFKYRNFYQIVQRKK